MTMSSRGVAVLVLLFGGAMSAAAQEGGDAEARSRALSQRMRVTLEQQSRELSRMQRELERAARADGRVRDSIVRTTSQRIAELAGEIARVQMEADRIQFQTVDAETRAQLLAQITSARAMANVTRALAGQQRALTFSTRARPRGYLGVILSSEQNTQIRGGRVITDFVSPSAVLSVTAGSPAAAARIEAGDTIVALGRYVLPGAVPMSELMVPGERLPVRLRRSGQERVVTVVVGADPTAGSSPVIAYYDPAGERARACAGEECTPSIGISGRGFTIPGTPVPPMMPDGTPAPARPPASPRTIGIREGMLFWSSSDYSIAGAMMTSITAELQELTGASAGILVLRVAPGTPASTSGLRGGDVIVRINDDDAEGVRDLQRAVQRVSTRGGRSVALVVSRRKVEQPITLQW